MVYFLKRKSEVADKIKQYILTSRYTSKKMKVLRTNNGKEFVNREVNELLGATGITHQTTIPYNVEQNGRTEREIRTLVEAARSMINGLGKELWSEAINMAVYVLNRTGKGRTEGKTPYELWEGKQFDVSSLTMIFGSEVADHIPKEKRLKWDPKGKKGIFMGYEKSKGYRIYYPDEGFVDVRRDIIVLSGKAYVPPNVKSDEKDNAEELVISLDIEHEQWTSYRKVMEIAIMNANC